MGLTIRDLLVKEFGVTFTPRINQVVDEVDTGLEPVMRQNPSRIAFLVVNAGGFTINLFPAPFTPAGAGIRIEPNGGAFIAHWKEDGEVVSSEWLAQAVGSTSQVLVLEVVIERPTQEAGA